MAFQVRKSASHLESSHRQNTPTTMNVTDQILRVLDDALNLQGRSARFDRNTPLLGALPELDSMAVLALITGLETHFGIAFSDEDLNGNVFSTVGSLSDLVQQALTEQGS